MKIRLDQEAYMKLYQEEILLQSTFKKKSPELRGILEMRLNNAHSIDCLDALDLIRANFGSDRKIATMESCTAGMVAVRLTEAPGSSAYFSHGYVTYSTESKIAAGVPEDIIERRSVYSNACAIAMAKAAKQNGLAAYGIGVTGVAGPDRIGKIRSGTVWIAVVGPMFTSHGEFHFAGDRKTVREFATRQAIIQLAKYFLTYEDKNAKVSKVAK